MNIINSKYNSMVIIGNGFDMAHNYYTSYADFTKAVGMDFFTEYKEYLNTYLGVDSEWNYFEKQVEAMTGAFNQELFSDEGMDESIIGQFNTIFLNIKQKLIEYLRTETTRKQFHEIKSIQKFLGSNTICLNFNYTNIAEKYLCDIIYVHGSINENEIVLGYDPADAFCLAPYENRKWFKEHCRNRLAFKRFIKEEFDISCGDLLYQELCDEYEQILGHEDSGRGLETEDINRLKNADFFHEYMLIRCNNNIFNKNNISFENISKVVVLGHSIMSDEQYLSEILNKCLYLQQVIVFSYKGETQESWETKAQFFKPYCRHIENEMY